MKKANELILLLANALDNTEEFLSLINRHVSWCMGMGGKETLNSYNCPFYRKPKMMRLIWPSACKYLLKRT